MKKEDVSGWTVDLVNLHMSSDGEPYVDLVYHHVLCKSTRQYEQPDGAPPADFVTYHTSEGIRVDKYFSTKEAAILYITRKVNDAAWKTRRKYNYLCEIEREYLNMEELNHSSVQSA